MASDIRVAQFNTYDQGGGAEIVTQYLHENLAGLGIHSDLIVRYQRLGGERVWPLQPNMMKPRWYDDILRRLPNGGRFVRTARRLERPLVYWERINGYETTSFPEPRQALRKLPHPPDLIHAHNLHGDYFDLRDLVRVGRETPFLLTMHDQWLTTGHCAYPIRCDRWKTGCGACPDLTIYPAIQKDATHRNWQRKADIYRRTRLYLAVPSQSMLDYARQSMLWPAVHEARVINNGIDTAVFAPSTEEKRAIRARLGLPVEGALLMCMASGITDNPFKNYALIRKAVDRVRRQDASVRLVVVGALGDGAAGDGTAREEDGVIELPFQTGREAVADYYRAADIFLHAARSESWGLTTTEAMGCGVPVVATAVEGLMEQVRGLAGSFAVGETWGAEKATGALVDPMDADGMADAISHLLSDEELRRRLGANAAVRARTAFSIDLQLQRYARFYRDIIQQEPARKASLPP